MQFYWSFQEYQNYWNRLEFQVNYKKRTLICCSTGEVEESVTRHARILNDDEMLVKIRDICFFGKEVQYHALCRSRYQIKSECFLRQEKQHLGQCNEETPSDWPGKNTRNHLKQFAILLMNQLQNNKVYLLKDFNNFYVAALGDIGGSKY